MRINSILKKIYYLYEKIIKFILIILNKFYLLQDSIIISMIFYLHQVS